MKSDLISEWVLRYAENGLTVIPIYVESRLPKLESYVHYKDEPQEILEVQSWLDEKRFNDGELNGLAIMTGKCTKGKFRNLWVCFVDHIHK